MARFLKQSFAQICLKETDNGKLHQFNYWNESTLPTWEGKRAMRRRGKLTGRSKLIVQTLTFTVWRRWWIICLLSKNLSMKDISNTSIIWENSNLLKSYVTIFKIFASSFIYWYWGEASSLKVTLVGILNSFASDASSISKKVNRGGCGYSYMWAIRIVCVSNPRNRRD